MEVRFIHAIKMRLPLKQYDSVNNEINACFESSCNGYLQALKTHIEMKRVGVMLGDGTITYTNTFDLQNTLSFFQRLVNLMQGWSSTGISESSTDDLRRIYCQFGKQVGKYYVSSYFGIQFHVLPYYRIDREVIKIQKELVEISDNAAEISKLIARRGNETVKRELEKMGYEKLESQEIFQELFENDELVTKLETKVAVMESEFPKLQEMHDKKLQLIAELNNFLVELYQISPVLIDYNKLMSGEEGVVIYFDLETIKNQKTKERDSYINAKRISKEAAKEIVDALDQVSNNVKNL
jgi:hypothetical protein